MGKKMPAKQYQTNPVGLLEGKDQSAALPNLLSFPRARDRGPLPCRPTVTIYVDVEGGGAFSGSSHAFPN